MSSFLFIRFSFFFSDSFMSTVLSSTSLILPSAPVILLLVPSRVLLISFIASDFFGGNDAEAETTVLWPPHAELTHWKRL